MNLIMYDNKLTILHYIKPTTRSLFSVDIIPIYYLKKVETREKS